MRATLCGLMALLTSWAILVPPVAMAQSSSIEQEWRTLTDAQAAYQRGNSLAERGDLESAGREWDVATAGFQQVMRVNAMRTDLYAPLADIHIRRGHPAVAYALLTQQVRSGVNDLSVRIQVVRALRAMNRRSKAIMQAEDLRKAFPNEPEVTALYAELLAEDGQSDQALMLLTLVLPKLPLEGRFPGTDGVAMRKLHARLLLSKNRGTEAVGSLTDLLKARPSDSEALLLLGQAQLANGKHADAVTTLRRYLTLLPKDGRALAALGQALADSGQLLSGIEQLEHAGDSPEALSMLGQLYLRKVPPDTPAALAALGKALQLQPNNLRVCAELAQLRDQAGQGAQAVTEIERCTEPLLGADGGLGPSDGWAQKALFLRLDLQLKNNKFDPAMQTYKGVQARYPGLSSLQGKLAGALMRRGLSKLPTTTQPSNLGLPDLLEAHRMAPSLATAQALALGQIGAGQPQDALQTLQNYLKDGAGEPRFLGAYGRALRDAGQPQDALLVLQKAEGLTSNAPVNQALKLSLRQEIAQCYLTMQQPRLAQRYLDGTDELSQQIKAQSGLVSARMLFGAMPAGTMPSFPSVMFVTQGVLRGGPAVLPIQRAEAKLWQVLALLGNGQVDVAAKLLMEVAQLFDVASLEQVMGKGGLPHLQARVSLRVGDYYQGSTFAQQALSSLSPDQVRVLHGSMTAAYNNKAVEYVSKGDLDKASSLLRTALQQAQASNPQHQLHVLYNQAVLSIMRARYEEAKGLLAKIDGQQLPDALVAQGALLEGQGDPRGALEHYRRYLQVAVTQNPPLPQVAQLREWVDSMARFYEGAAPNSEPTADPTVKPGKRPGRRQP